METFSIFSKIDQQKILDFFQVLQTMIKIRAEFLSAIIKSGNLC
jgi:hypothetical protein